MGIKNHIINFIGICELVAGIYIGLSFLTVGLFATLYSYGMNKDIRVFLGLIGVLAFSVMLTTVGIGILRRRSLSRVLLIIISYLVSAGIILCFFSNIRERLKILETKYFDTRILDHPWSNNQYKDISTVRVGNK